MKHIDVPNPVVTDLTIASSDTLPTLTGPRTWYRVEKDLHLHSLVRKCWLFVQLTSEEALSTNEKVIYDVCIHGKHQEEFINQEWEQRRGGIWLRRKAFNNDIVRCVTDATVLFGEDAVDPRPQWSLLQTPLSTVADLHTPAPRLSIRHGREVLRKLPRSLTMNTRQKFRILQISDTHMVTGTGICKDAIDASGNRVPNFPADPRTIAFIESILDIEKPDLVILAGDQLHHGIADTETALYKVLAPIIKKSIPFAAVFGNHDDEGEHVLSRKSQMTLLESLPHSFCKAGPDTVDGIGNYVFQILSTRTPHHPVATLYFLDSHGEIAPTVRDPDYDPIKTSQIQWFKNAVHSQVHQPSLSMVFQHIPLPEFDRADLHFSSGKRGEPTMAPTENTGFYDALVEANVSVFACGHDHVNDFCALLPTNTGADGDEPSSQTGPWLCHSGSCGYGAYGSYGGKFFHRGMRLFELDELEKSVRTWKRVEYCDERVDEEVLVLDGKINNPYKTQE